MSVKVYTYVTREEAEAIKKLCNHQNCSRYALLQRYIREGLKEDLAKIPKLPVIIKKKEEGVIVA